MRKLIPLLVALAPALAAAQELKVALITGKTGILEPYAKETETGFMMGLEYLTNGRNGNQRPQTESLHQGRPEQA